MQIFPDVETTFLLPGLAGQVEIVTTPVRNIPAKGTVVICHPHPLFGGTMHNKVVTTLAKVFLNHGLNVVRFNFRGVGKSEGLHDEGRGEVDDLVTVAEWITQIPGEHSIWLAGFSFGAYVAAQGALRIPTKTLVTVAPMVSRFKQNPTPLVMTCPWILIQGEQDEIVSPQEVFDWVETLHPKPVVIRMPKAGHFFHGQLIELRKELESCLYLC